MTNATENPPAAEQVQLDVAGARGGGESFVVGDGWTAACRRSRLELGTAFGAAPIDLSPFDGAVSSCAECEAPGTGRV